MVARFANNLGGGAVVQEAVHVTFDIIVDLEIPLLIAETTVTGEATLSLWLGVWQHPVAGVPAKSLQQSFHCWASIVERLQTIMGGWNLTLPLASCSGKNLTAGPVS
jgi:hypothetical protein